MIVSEFCLGSMRVIKVHELDLNGFAATQLLPGLDPSVLAKHGEWIDPRTKNILKVRTEAGFSRPVRIPVPGVFVLQGIRFLSTPGHSVDHAAISITSQGWLARYAAKTNAVYFSSHFSFTSVGRITQTGETFGWEFASSSSHLQNQPGALVVRERNIGEFSFSQ